MTHGWRAALLVAGLARLAAAGDDPQQLRDDVDAVAKELRASPLLAAPFAVPRASFFHAALDVPPLESAETLAPGTWYLRLRSSHTRSYKQETLNGIDNLCRGIYHEWLALDASWGFAPRWEAGLWLPLVGWDEAQDNFYLFDAAGTAIVRDEGNQIAGTEASRRHDNVSVVGLRVKRTLLEAQDAGFDLAASAQLKIPIGRPRDLTNAGTWDLALTALATIPRTWGTLHVNLGVVFPLGSQDLFIPEADVNLDPILQGGVAAVFPVSDRLSFGIQVEANSSAFGDVPFLAGSPVTAVAGARWLVGHYVLELGAGTGFDWDTSYQWLAFLSFGRIF